MYDWLRIPFLYMHIVIQISNKLFDLYLHMLKFHILIMGDFHLLQ